MAVASLLPCSSQPGSPANLDRHPSVAAQPAAPSSRRSAATIVVIALIFIAMIALLTDSWAAKSANIETLDPAFADLPILLERADRPIDTAMSNSFGFGGTNACLVMARV